MTVFHQDQFVLCLLWHGSGATFRNRRDYSRPSLVTNVYYGAGPQYIDIRKTVSMEYAVFSW